MHDAIVIGAGPNGLTAANLLADAGWEVLLLEAEEEVGGAVRSDTAVAPGFVHDTCISFYPTRRRLAGAAFVAPRASRSALGQRGCAGGQPRCRTADGHWSAGMWRTPRSRSSGWHRGTARSGLSCAGTGELIGSDLVAALLGPFPLVRHGAALAVKMAMPPGSPFLDQVRRLTASARWIGEHFSGEGPGLLLTCNAQHADLAPDAAVSGRSGLLLVMLAQQIGYAVPCGVAGELPAALARRFIAKGGVVQLNARACEIVVRVRRAVRRPRFVAAPAGAVA